MHDSVANSPPPQRRVVVAEPQFQGATHASVNAALLSAVTLAYPHARHVFHATEDHSRWVRQALASQPPLESAGPVTWKDLPRRPTRSGATWLQRLQAEFAVYREILVDTRTAKADLLLLCSVSRWGLVYLRLLLPFLLPRSPVLVITHQLNQLSDPEIESTRRANHLQTLLRLPVPANLRFLAPAAPIFNELLAEFPDIARRFSWLELPYLWQSDQLGCLPQEPGRLVFGFFGVGRPDRIGHFCELARRVHRSHPNARFVHVGYARPPAPQLESWRQDVEGLGTSPLPLDELMRRASEVHYAVWTAPPEAYRMTLSASFLDSLSHVKPCIFLENPFVSHYHRQMGGIGYPCTDMEEMYEVVTRLLKGPSPDTYRRQCERIIHGRQCFAVSTTAAMIRQEASLS